MKKVIGILLFVLFSNALVAQDIITKKDGEDIQAKVLEVLTSEIKYKKFDFQDGPTYTELKSNILMIRYENGLKDIFVQEKVTGKPIGQIIESSYDNYPVKKTQDLLTLKFGYSNLTQRMLLTKRVSELNYTPNFDNTFTLGVLYQIPTKRDIVMQAGWSGSIINIRSKGKSEADFYYLTGNSLWLDFVAKKATNRKLISDVYVGIGAGFIKVKGKYRQTAFFQGIQYLRDVPFNYYILLPQITVLGAEFVCFKDFKAYTELGIGPKGNVIFGVQYDFLGKTPKPIN